MVYVYIHGFNSAYDPSSEKVAELSKVGDVLGVTYNTFGTYEEIVAEISVQVSTSEDVIFVGTSLGGFWAAEMGSRYGAPSVIINPCIDPFNMLQKYVGVEQTNYVNGEVKTLTQEAVNSYPATGISRSGRYLPQWQPLVLLDMGDEVIDSFQTREDLEGFPIVHWDGGSHRFNHMQDAVGHIQTYAKHCSYLD